MVELQKLEEGLTEEIETKKEKLKERKEKEKSLLREKIASLRQQAELLETQLLSVESPRHRHGSKSLPDSSEYQKIILDLCKEDKEKKKTKKDTKKWECNTRKRDKLRTELQSRLQLMCTDAKGKIKLPKTEELKELVAIAESSEGTG